MEKKMNKNYSNELTTLTMNDYHIVVNIGSNFDSEVSTFNV